MRLLEFQKSNILMRDLINALGRVFDMERVGGSTRVYEVGQRKGIIFLINNSLKAIGLIWSQGTTRVESVGVWNKIDFDGSPEFMVDIPAHATIDTLIEPLVRFIRQPREGMVEGIELSEEAIRNVTPQEFRNYAREFLKDKSSYMTLDDLKKVAERYGVSIPSAIRHDRSLRVDAHHWNLRDDDLVDAAKAVGAQVGVPDPNDPNYQTAVELAKVQNIKSMASHGRVILLGRKPSGEVFEIPGVAEITAKIERMLQKDLDDGGPVGSSMEEQYKLLEQKVELIASGKSEFVKSLLITGMPSAGKTFRVMEVIKRLGLKEGEDYALVGGKTTVKATYRVLIEQVNGLAVFDDCDSVANTEDGENMLKKALDTDPIREVNYNAEGLMNTNAMPRHERDAIVHAMSRILRGVPTRADIYLFDDHRKIPQRKTEHYDSLEDLVATYDDAAKPTNDLEWEMARRDLLDTNKMNATVSKSEITEIQDWVLKHLPNKIDFQGRIIFISNKSADEWNSAILTRAFHQDMQFSDVEMFDYISTILEHIKTPRLTEEDKQGVLAYLKELWEAGKITRPVNFRLVQQAFDLRLLNGWRELVAAIG